MDIEKMSNEELFNERKTIMENRHSVKDVVCLYEIEDELEKREQSIDENDFDEEKVEGVDDE